jgi:hypothetical protein
VVDRHHRKRQRHGTGRVQYPFPRFYNEIRVAVDGNLAVAGQTTPPAYELYAALFEQEFNSRDELVDQFVLIGDDVAPGTGIGGATPAIKLRWNAADVKASPAQTTRLH